MKSCPSTEVLKAFVVGDLDGRQLQQIATHSADCPACQEALESFDDYEDGLLSELKQLPDSQTPSIPEHIMAAATAGASSARTGERTSSTIDLDPGRAYAGRLADGPVRLGRFELRSKLGDGSFGYVFRARDLELDRDVAVKIGRVGSLAGENEVHTFLREARAIAQLSHHNIVAIYDSGQTDDGVCFLVSELVEGETLETRLQRERFEPRQATRLAADLADALGYAHGHDAWDRFIKLYTPLVYYWCQRHNLKQDDIPDVIQEVFRSVAEHILRFRKERAQDTFRGWLRVIARNKALDLHRRLDKEPRGKGGTEAFDHLNAIPAPETPDSEHEDDSGAKSILFRQALELIREEFRETTWKAFWLVVVEGRPPTDVSDEMQMSPGAVRVAKCRVLQRLRIELGDLIDE